MPQLETLVLANHAEAHEGLLYIMGGGWTDLRRTFPEGGSPPTSHFGIAISVLVGWTETNRPHRLVLTVEPEDGGAPLVRVEGEIVAGRHPEAVEGQDSRNVLAINGDVQFPQAGGYRVVAELGDQRRTVSFRVRDIAGPPGQPMP